jgi:hypothetical protein
MDNSSPMPNAAVVPPKINLNKDQVKRLKTKLNGPAPTALLGGTVLSGFI